MTIKRTKQILGMECLGMDENTREITRFLKAGKPLPAHYKDMLFPAGKKPKEYELVYDDKERVEDILADTMAVPLQKVKTFGHNGKEGWTNKLIFGDNLQALKTLLRDPEVKGNVKCICIDPPFATRREFGGKKGERAYQDKIEGAKFIEFLRKRLILMHKLLASDGSIYVHLDWRKCHYIKAVLDEVFNDANFQNEIIWQRLSARSDSKTYNHIHDVIYFYTKTQNFDFRTQYSEYSDTYIKKFYRYKNEDGRLFSLGDLTARGIRRGESGRPWRGVDPTKLDNHWKVKISTLDELDKQGKIYWPPKGKVPRLKQYLDERQGRPLQSIWSDISPVQYASSEKTDYPTQKPEVLLERIIRASSNPGDIVLDAFAGSGTTLAVAEKLGRKWIGIDSSKLAIYVMQKRMLNLKKGIGNKGKPLKPTPFTLYNAGLYDYDLVSQLGEDEYKRFALELFQAEPRSVKIGGFHFEGTLYNCPVHVYLGKGKLTEEYVDDLHKFVDGKADKVFIIAPAGKVVPLEDYIVQDDTKYYFLRIPYSVIDEIHKTSFVRIIQPASVDEINDPLVSTGFDFVIPPEVECDYYKMKDPEKLVEEFVINIKSFEPEQITRNPIEFKDMEALSMVMIDRDYNGKFFSLTDYYFRDEIESNDSKVEFSDDGVGEKIMIIYLDVLGNEKREVKRRSDFKKRVLKKRKRGPKNEDKPR